MPEKHLHIIAFDIPYPPNYGGVIDIFYKIRALHTRGVKVHLHCFEYGRQSAQELEKLCSELHFYPRMTGWRSALSWKPFIVMSRHSPLLIQNLLKDNYPILFEGLHSCYYLDDKRLSGRFLIYRESNIEHHYYYHLFKAEHLPYKKLYFLIESWKLRLFQRKLKHASSMLMVSKEDKAYLQAKFPGKKVEYLPSFHKDDDLSVLPGKGTFAFYHGNLEVAENVLAAEYLVSKVFKGLNETLIIAGLNPPQRLIRMIRKFSNVQLVINPSDDAMYDLMRAAQVNVLVTFQTTGLKLKLLNALFCGRFCLVNPQMVAGTELAGLCETGTDAAELIEKLAGLMHRTFDESMIRKRKETLMQYHSNIKNCEFLLNLLPLYNS
jgi:hypothetical protein